MAAPPARARADYDYLIKLLLIGDSGPLSLMANGLNSKSGTQLVRNGFARSQLPTIVEQWVSCWCTMSLTNHLLTHASDNVNKILVGNKADMDESKRAVPTSKGQALADEYGIKFFETSAKTNLNVEQVFFSIARDIKQRLADTDSRAEPTTIKINQPDAASGTGNLAQKSACCGS
ncbi:hypothetical protein RJ640_015567 [Escallonia rubra]|uniref:Uncharacterized protein n=1 Tax=Escallonia rubra TaxID=112253 RepID=A0AA88QSM4_9ASTE|nr:hypothetical protein RJ640_015567 [Escallonia rubra]